jgi:hypothetical protein
MESCDRRSRLVRRRSAPRDQLAAKHIHGGDGTVARTVDLQRPRRETAGEQARRLGALKVATEPEQIVGGAAWQIAEKPHDAHGIGSRQKRRHLDRAISGDPHICG